MSVDNVALDFLLMIKDSVNVIIPVFLSMLMECVRYATFKDANSVLQEILTLVKNALIVQPLSSMVNASVQEASRYKVRQELVLPAK